MTRIRRGAGVATLALVMLVVSGCMPAIVRAHGDPSGTELCRKGLQPFDYCHLGVYRDFPTTSDDRSDGIIAIGQEAEGYRIIFSLNPNTTFRLMAPSNGLPCRPIDVYIPPDYHPVTEVPSTFGDHCIWGPIIGGAEPYLSVAFRG